MTVSAFVAQVHEDAQNLSLRPGEILWIDPLLTCWDGDEFRACGLQDLVDYELEAEHLDASMQPLLALFEEEDDYVRASIVRKKFFDGDISGFIVCAEQPVIFDASETGFSCSWGIYRKRHFMAPSIEQAWHLARQWAQGNLEQAIASDKAQAAEQDGGAA